MFKVTIVGVDGRLVYESLGNQIYTFSNKYVFPNYHGFILCVISFQQSLDQCLKSGSVGSATFPGSGSKWQNINQKLQTLKTQK